MNLAARALSKPPKAESKLQLTISANTGRRFVPFLRRYVARAHSLLNPPLMELSLALVNDRRMSSLHQQFMGIPTPTDVLTFPLDLDEKGQETAGEVVICVPEAARQSSERGTPVEEELLLYALHGMLHLCGFDDRTATGFRRMHRMEDDILGRLGVGPVFVKKKLVNGRPMLTPRAAQTVRATNRSSAKRTGKPTHRRARAAESPGARR